MTLARWREDIAVILAFCDRLEANKANGHQLTRTDEKHTTALALQEAE